MLSEQIRIVKSIQYQDQQRFAVMSAYFSAANKRLEWMNNESKKLLEVMNYIKSRYKEVAPDHSRDLEIQWLQQQLAHCREQNLAFDIEQEALLSQEISR
jgi:hypothetical protein